MRVRELPLEERHVEHFEAQGIEELYPPQAAAVEAGVCEGESVVAAVPTASGKTMIAQLATLTADGPAVYVVPLRALATEKAETFGDLPGPSVGVATGDFDASDEDLRGHDVVVATAEKVDAAIRHGAAWVEQVECAVVDEVHLLDDRSRGPTLEVTIAKLRRLNPALQLVALSATVPNADAVADWLDATPIHSDWRPVDLRRGVHAEGGVAWEDEPASGDAEQSSAAEQSSVTDASDAAKQTSDADASGGAAASGAAASDGDATAGDDADDEGAVDDLGATAELVVDALADGGQCLAFVSSRRAARSLASELTTALETPLLPADAASADGSGEVGSAAGDEPGSAAGDEPGSAAGDEPGPATDDGSRIVRALRQTAQTATGEALAEVATEGVAFHHAGLRGEHRRIVETGFRNGELGVLCATPTLAAGVNVPARRVIVRDHRRYGDDGYEPLSTLEVHQMFGRAGRPGLDPYGEAILVAEDAVGTSSDEPSEADASEDDDERRELADRYLDGTPEPVTSALDDPTALRPHVLASVATGMASSRDDLEALLRETFYEHTGDGEVLLETAVEAVDRLLDAGMLVERDCGGGASSDGSDGRGGSGDAARRARLEATDLGALVSQVYVDPVTGADVVAALERAEDLERVTALTVCEPICDTAEMPTRYVGRDEAGELAEFAMRREGELARSVSDFDGDFHDWLASLKTARLLADYATGAPLADVVEGYAVGPGDVRRYAERAEWLLSATESLAEHVESDVTERIRETREQLADRQE